MVIPPQTESWDDPVKCPHCGFEYTHITSVHVAHGPNVTGILPGGKVDHYTSRETRSFSGRGSVVMIRMFCENGHIFDLLHQFHKGMTYRELVYQADASEVSDDWPPDLWRD